ncbi:MarR family transcriptional regulator [Myceligenerans indicum]|uniref:MarR family transcriptional regulator n=1 Tax=Myceligenerans indicum TaxID=2593663 RepID=A0ABS1LJW3_9MICO|nr:MarR family transcriptional regulator [Myceligenerans indicum]MBL0886540.1 MarR family transcriptional regulator [Myceligenerans indicum]
MRTAGETVTSTPHDDAGDAMAAALLRETVLAARRAARRAAQVLGPEGYTLDEWLVLDVLGTGDGLTMSELREAVYLDKATLGRRVDDLVSKALIYREVDGLDRRVIRVYLSSRGRDVVSRLTARLAQD